MDIYILDGFETVGILSTYQSIIWNKQYNGISEFELVVDGSKENQNLLQIGRYLYRSEDRTDDRIESMIIENQQLSYDVERGWMLKVTGCGLKGLLKRRIVWEQINSAGTVEDAIRKAVEDNAVDPSDDDRAIPNLTMAAAQGFEETADIQVFGENLAEWVSKCCESYGYGWDIYQSGEEYVFTLYKGTDRTYSSENPVVFSPEFDNLLSYTYEGTKQANAALIGGEGEGTSKRTASIGSSTGLDRVEAYIDGSDVSSNGEIITLQTYLAMLRSYGKEQLSSVLKPKFEGQVDPDSTYKLNEDYFLGDVVQIDNNQGMTATTRIIEIIYSEDASGYAVVPTFEEWEV